MPYLFPLIQPILHPGYLIIPYLLASWAVNEQSRASFQNVVSEGHCMKSIHEKGESNFSPQWH